MIFFPFFKVLSHHGLAIPIPIVLSMSCRVSGLSTKGTNSYKERWRFWLLLSSCCFLVGLGGTATVTVVTVWGGTTGILSVCFGWIGTGPLGGTGLGCNGRHLGAGPLRVALPVVLSGRTKVNGKGKLTWGRAGGSGTAAGSGWLDVASWWGGVIPCFSVSCSFFFSRLMNHWLTVVWLTSGSWIVVSLITFPLQWMHSCISL